MKARKPFSALIVIKGGVRVHLYELGAMLYPSTQQPKLKGKFSTLPHAFI